MGYPAPAMSASVLGVCEVEAAPVRASAPAVAAREAGSSDPPPAQEQQMVDPPSRDTPVEGAVDFRTRALRTLLERDVPFLVTGAYAFFEYTGIRRNTKDLDFALCKRHLPEALRALDDAGFRTEVHPERWLGKAWSGEHFVDLIFSSRNGLTPVDDDWFRFARSTTILGLECKIVPAEELLWSKAFVHERERYDGADIDHIIRANGHSLDWARIVRRFGSHWEVLLAHLILYRYAFPSARSQVPGWVMRELLERARREQSRGDLPDPVCRGHLVSGSQYASDYQEHGYVPDPQAPPPPAETFSFGPGPEGEEQNG